MLELAASRATDPTARDHPGREPRVRPHPVVIGSELIYYEQARTRTYCLHLYPLPTYYFRLTTCDVLTTCRGSDLPYCYLPYFYLPYYLP